jgi:probable HAF family extracellular repeat protein
MKSKRLGFAFGILLLAQLATPSVLAAQGRNKQQASYTVIDLGTLGGTFSLAAGLNNRGSVIGDSNLPGDLAHHAFLWRHGIKTDLGTLGGPNSEANFRPSDSDEVVGFAETSNPDPFGEHFCGFGTGLTCPPFLWRDGVMTALPTLGGNDGEATGVNNAGQVVGFVENASLDPTCPPPQVPEVKPVLWEKGEVRELPTLPGDINGQAIAINDKGQIVGGSGGSLICTAISHSVLWQNGTVIDLGNLGGTMNCCAEDINNQGQVVGSSDLPGDTVFHAFLWQNGVMIDLGTLPGDVDSLAFGINNKGQVVGASFDASGNARAFVWQNGVMTDLNALIPSDSSLFLQIAFRAINARGQIAGLAFEKETFDGHAFLLTPTNGGATDESVPPANLSATSERMSESLSEKARMMLRQRLGPRYRIPSLGAPLD